MLQNTSTPRSYSASTELWLIVDNKRIELGQISRDFIISIEDTVLPRGTRCDLHATVDEQESIWPIVLPDGLGPGTREARIEASADQPDDEIPF